MQLQIRVPAEEEYEEWIRIYLLASSIHLTESAATRRRPWIESDRLLSGVRRRTDGRHHRHIVRRDVDTRRRTADGGESKT